MRVRDTRTHIHLSWERRGVNLRKLIYTQILSSNADGVEFLSSYSCTDLMSLGPPRALTSGPEGTFLWTTDMTLSHAQVSLAQVEATDESLSDELCHGEEEEVPLVDLTGHRRSRQPLGTPESPICVGAPGRGSRPRVGILESLLGGSALRDVAQDRESEAARKQERLMGLRNQDKVVPKAFMLAKPSARLRPQLCIMDPQDLKSSLHGKLLGEDFHPTCVDLGLQTRPDLLDCCRDLLVVGTSSGSSQVQIFRVGTSPTSLSHITDLALCTPSISFDECRLRGVALTLRSDGWHLTALLGRYHREEETTSFMSLTKSGLGNKRLAPLVCGSFRIQRLDNRFSATSEVSQADASSSSPAAGPCDALQGSRIEAMLQGMEARLEQRLERIEDLLNAVLERVKLLEARQGRS